MCDYTNHITEPVPVILHGGLDGQQKEGHHGVADSHLCGSPGHNIIADLELARRQEILPEVSAHLITSHQDKSSSE